MSDVCPVSVIIPFFNNKRTLVKSVESVLLQTLPPAELILLDDGSTDGSYEEIAAFIKEHDNHVTKVHLERFEENKGVYPIRNYALDISSQPFVAFQDADDFWHLDKLKHQYAYFEKDDDLYLVCSRVGLFEKKPDEKWSEDIDIVGAKALTPRWVLWRNVMVTISVMIRKKDEFRFRTNKRRGSDMGLWLDIILSGHKGVFIPSELAYVRKHLVGAGGLSGNMKKAEIAHQRNLREMHEKGYISLRYLKILSFWSYMKFVRRSVLSSIRNRLKPSV